MQSYLKHESNNGEAVTKRSTDSGSNPDLPFQLKIERQGYKNFMSSLKEDSAWLSGESYGMKEAWQLAKWVIQLSPNVRSALFGYADSRNVFRFFSAEEVKVIYDRSKERQDFFETLQMMIQKSGKAISITELEDFFSKLEDIE